MTLFDPGARLPDPERPPSAGRRRTERNRAELEAGRHPATGRPLLHAVGEPGPTCSGCVYLGTRGGVSATYYKCGRHRRGVTGGPATDVRIGWPACDLYDTGQLTTWGELVVGDRLAPGDRTVVTTLEGPGQTVVIGVRFDGYPAVMNYPQPPGFPVTIIRRPGPGEPFTPQPNTDR